MSRVHGLDKLISD